MSRQTWSTTMMSNIGPNNHQPQTWTSQRPYWMNERQQGTLLQFSGPPQMPARPAHAPRPTQDARLIPSLLNSGTQGLQHSHNTHTGPTRGNYNRNTHPVIRSTGFRRKIVTPLDKHSKNVTKLLFQKTQLAHHAKIWENIPIKIAKQLKDIFGNITPPLPNTALTAALDLLCEKTKENLREIVISHLTKCQESTENILKHTEETKDDAPGFIAEKRLKNQGRKMSTKFIFYSVREGLQSLKTKTTTAIESTTGSIEEIMDVAIATESIVNTLTEIPHTTGNTLETTLPPTATGTTPETTHTPTEEIINTLVKERSEDAPTSAEPPASVVTTPPRQTKNLTPLPQRPRKRSRTGPGDSPLSPFQPLLTTKRQRNNKDTNAGVATTSSPLATPFAVTQDTVVLTTTSPLAIPAAEREGTIIDSSLTAERTIEHMDPEEQEFYFQLIISGDLNKEKELFTPNEEINFQRYLLKTGCTYNSTEYAAPLLTPPTTDEIATLLPETTQDESISSDDDLSYISYEEECSIWTKTISYLHDYFRKIDDGRVIKDPENFNPYIQAQYLQWYQDGVRASEASEFRLEGWRVADGRKTHVPYSPNKELRYKKHLEVEPPELYLQQLNSSTISREEDNIPLEATSTTDVPTQKEAKDTALSQPLAKKHNIPLSSQPTAKKEAHPQPRVALRRIDTAKPKPTPGNRRLSDPQTSTNGKTNSKTRPNFKF